MSRFVKRKAQPPKAISTASLPDVIFMLLFFFMVTTVMRETEVQVNVTLPTASQVKKLEKKSIVSFVYIGRPVRHLQGLYGIEPIIQLNDKLISEEGIPSESIKDFILFEREKLDESDKNKMTVSLRIDQNIPMGKVNDVKQALRMANALKINYSARRPYETIVSR